MIPAADITSAISQISRGFRRLKGIGDAANADTGEIVFDEWDWEVGVGLYGYFRDAEERDDQAAFGRLIRWYENQLARGLPRRQVNSTSPMLVFSLLAEKFEREDWKVIVRDWAQWIFDEMPRTEEGGYQHLVKERDNEGQLWDDTLFMAVLFMTTAGRLCERPDWIEDAHYQFLCHIRFLGDPASGLFFHGWTFLGRHNYARALWARGNAWITIAIPELFRLAPPEGAIARYLKEVYRTQVATLQALQNDEGMFHTLLDDTSSPVEASATAGIGYGILAGIREGLIDESFRVTAERSLNAILSRIDETGLLMDVSDGTPMGEDLDFYRRIKNLPTPYGQALGGLFLMESRRHAR
ncbi:glycoside hydrolase family 88/105 protein [Rhizobium giardinii]|uniref:beta-galactosidase BglB n=1 Tax=Rhizobium giardinii TaxID=56731 RepID=UPI000DD75639